MKDCQLCAHLSISALQLRAAVKPSGGWGLEDKCCGRCQQLYGQHDWQCWLPVWAGRPLLDLTRHSHRILYYSDGAELSRNQEPVLCSCAYWLDLQSLTGESIHGLYLPMAHARFNLVVPWRDTSLLDCKSCQLSEVSWEWGYLISPSPGFNLSLETVSADGFKSSSEATGLCPAKPGQGLSLAYDNHSTYFLIVT